MQELMAEIISSSNFTSDEDEILNYYFNNAFDFVNTKNYVYGIDDNGFVIRKDCHGNMKSIYGWQFVDGIPVALNTKTNIKKSKTDIKSTKSVYRRIYKEFGLNLDEWLSDEK